MLWSFFIRNAQNQPHQLVSDHRRPQAWARGHLPHRKCKDKIFFNNNILVRKKNLNRCHQTRLTGSKYTSIRLRPGWGSCNASQTSSWLKGKEGRVKRWGGETEGSKERERREGGRGKGDKKGVVDLPVSKIPGGVHESDCS